MQQLLGKISALDPGSSQHLRVIACFDELIVGDVNTRGLLSAAAALAGCNAGFRSEASARALAVTPAGEPTEPGPVPREPHREHAGEMVVWLERAGSAQANDRIILERLALALRVRHGSDGRARAARRELQVLVDADADAEHRRTAAAQLGLAPDAGHRVLAAPLFAVWSTHPTGREDVVATPHGLIHAIVVGADDTSARATPLGIGVAARAEGLHHSFRTALVALRLCDAPRTPQVRAEEYGAVVSLLADMPEGVPIPDVDALDDVMQQPWASLTLDAVVRADSLRHAARLAGVHHSTMQARLDQLSAHVGYDPLSGMGRTRMGMAYLVWRLRCSRVLDLPPPVAPT